MAVAPKKHRSRELVLTSRRLLCVKQKPGRGLQVRTELFIRPSDKERDLRNLVSSVEPKGEREFVVITVSGRRSQAGSVEPDWSSVQPIKSHCYIAASSSIAAMWIRKLREVIEAPPVPAPHGANGTTNGVSHLGVRLRLNSRT